MVKQGDEEKQTVNKKPKTTNKRDECFPVGEHEHDWLTR